MAELAGRDRRYTTTEWPGEGPRSVYELYAGSIRHDVEVEQSESVRDEDCQTTTAENSGLPGADPIIATSSTDSEPGRTFPVREEGETDKSVPGECTAMLGSTSPSTPAPPQAFDTVIPNTRPLSVQGSESSASASRVSVPRLSQQELDALAGALHLKHLRSRS